MKNAARVAAIVLCLGLSVTAQASERSPGFMASGPGCSAGAGPRIIETSLRTQSPASPHGARATKTAAQVTRNERANVTFEVRPSGDGGAELTATAAGVEISKSVQPTGEFVLTVKAGADAVTVAVSGRGTRLSRGRQSVDLPRGADAPGRRPAARRMLADSDAIVRYRAMADGLMASDDRSPAALGVIIADAMVGALSGDVGAPRRVADFLARGGRKNARPAGLAIDCFTLMEQRMVEAWSDYVSCWMSVSNIMFSDYWQELCAVRWVIQVESYWFNFLSCSGFNF